VKIKYKAANGTGETRHMSQTSRLLRASAVASTAIVAAVALVACSKKHDATQSAARVDSTEITVHQINYRLQRERVRSDQMDAASRKVLEQLIDEQLVVEKAEKNKLDKQPDAEQALAAARRDVLAHAYIEQVGQSVPPPAEDTLHRYFDDNPALFADRRIYTLHEFLARVPAEQIPALQALIDSGKPAADAVAWMNAQNVVFREQQGAHPAEQVPLGSLKQLSTLAEGHGMLASAGNQVHITYVVSSEPQPVTFERAKGAIAQYLTVEARRKATEGNLAALRGSAKIQYAAEYQALAASQPTDITTKDIAATAPVQAPAGQRVSLPTSAAAGEQVTLPTAGSGVQVTLPNAMAPGVRVSLPDAPASRVEVRLPPQGGSDGGKK
jgi:EpsD family peptidyl-prolyl cis-trans isomerase